MSKRGMCILSKKIVKLIDVALDARNNAYTPYSNYNVGVALLTKDGEIFNGANIENASFPAGICAERSAMVKAIMANKFKFDVIVITGAPANSNKLEQYVYPCGICRQFMAEFFDKDTKVVVAKSGDEYITYDFEEILPHSFGKTNLDF